MSLFPLVILDSHTTGIPVYSKGEVYIPQILELSALLYFPDVNLENTESFQNFISHKEIMWQNDQVEKQNKWLEIKISKGGESVFSLEEANLNFQNWIQSIKENYNIEGPVNFAGRKPDSFDIPIMAYNGIDTSPINFKGIDVCSIFYRDNLNWVPSLKNILRALHIKANSNVDALSRCREVAEILRKSDQFRFSEG